jgi:acetyl-CoA decarbonylase/synthase complex subunit gamma
VTIGVGDRQVKIGGELVMRRHELRYFNPTAIAIIVDDEMSEGELLKRVKETSEFKYTYIGRDLRLDMIAVRSVSKDPKKFEEAVKKVAEATDMPLILWSFDPHVLEQGLLVVQKRRPLLYAATKDNWKDMGELALKYNCPLAVYSPNDLKMLRSLTNTLRALGVDDLALDPGAEFGEGLAHTINNLTMLRTAACKEDDELFGFPLVGSSIAIWEGDGGRPEVIKWREACLASMMISRYADLLMLNSTDVWVLLPLVILRENIYTDPRKPVSVDPGLRIIGKPDEKSPVMFTTNFALTYFTVLNDIESAKINCFLLIVDTEGISVESAVAGRKLTAGKVANAMKEAKIEDKVKHRKLIIPGLAARLKGEIEDLTKWDVMVGPRDSSGIPEFLSKHWAT